MRKFLFLFAISLNLLACTKTESEAEPVIEPEPSTPEVPPITEPLKNKSVIWRFDGSYHTQSSATLYYDSTKRLVKIEGGGYATEFNVYYQNDTISYITNSYWTNGQFFKNSRIFVYNKEKFCQKIIYKTKSSWNPGIDMEDANAFFSDTTNHQIGNYDSLAYSPTNQLKKIIIKQAGGYEAITQEFFYDNPQSLAPSKIVDYGVDGSGNKIIASETIITTNDIDHPAYRLWFMTFLDLEVPVTPISPSDLFRKNFVFVKKCITKFSVKHYADPVLNSKEFIYYYNADSTLFTGRYLIDDVTFDRLWYGFKKV